MRTAKDVMSKRVVTLSPDATVAEAARLFEQARISGAPVVGPDGALLGVLSQTDLMRHHERCDHGQTPAFYQQGDAVMLCGRFESAGRSRVAEVMTPAVLTAEEEAPVEDVARFMLARRVHRVLITRDGKLRGIVTSMDLMALVAGAAPRRRARAKARSRRRARPGVRGSAAGGWGEERAARA